MAKENVFRYLLLNVCPNKRSRSSLRTDTKPARTDGSSRSCGFRSVLFQLLKIPKNLRGKKKKRMVKNSKYLCISSTDIQHSWVGGSSDEAAHLNVTYTVVNTQQWLIP